MTECRRRMRQRLGRVLMARTIKIQANGWREVKIIEGSSFHLMARIIGK